MTLKDYIEVLRLDIVALEDYEDRIGPLDCCDNRELEILQGVLETLEEISDGN